MTEQEKFKNPLDIRRAFRLASGALAGSLFLAALLCFIGDQPHATVLQERPWSPMTEIVEVSVQHMPSKSTPK
jgi:hypothetical protein